MGELYHEKGKNGILYSPSPGLRSHSSTGRAATPQSAVRVQVPVAPLQMRSCKDVQPVTHKIYQGGGLMEKIKGRLFIRAENETNYRPWSDLTEEEVKKISECLNREAAHAGDFRETA